MANPVYAVAADLVNYGAPAKALAGVSTAAQTAALTAASRVADGYIQNAFTLPLVTYTEDLTDAVCAIATWRLLASVRGFNPEAASNDAYRARKQDAEAWLEKVGKKELTPIWTDSSAGGKTKNPFTSEGQVSTTATSSGGDPLFVVGAPTPRGW